MRISQLDDVHSELNWCVGSVSKAFVEIKIEIVLTTLFTESLIYRLVLRDTSHDVRLLNLCYC